LQAVDRALGEQLFRNFTHLLGWKGFRRGVAGGKRDDARLGGRFQNLTDCGGLESGNTIRKFKLHMNTPFVLLE